MKIGNILSILKDVSMNILKIEPIALTLMELKYNLM